MVTQSSFHRSSTWAGGGSNHHLNTADFDALWADLAPGSTISYWTSRSLAEACADSIDAPDPEQARARAVRRWAQRKAHAGEACLTQKRRPDDMFDYRITRARSQRLRP